MSEEHYLELCDNPVQFENASSVNNVFFDEANKQEFINFIPDLLHLEYSQECKTKNASILGFCWTSWNEIVFITDQGIEFYQVLPDKRSLKLQKSQSINVNWYMYCPVTSVILLSTTVQGNVLQPFFFKNGTMSKMSKFEIELPIVPKPAKLSLSERDIAMVTMDGTCKKMHVLKLNTTGKFALNVVDNLVVVHHQSSQTSMIFDIKLRDTEGTLNIHQPVLPARSIHPYKIPLTGPAAVTTPTPVPCELWYLWYLQVKLQPVVNLMKDKGKLIDFLLQRRDCKMVIVSVCFQLLNGSDKGNLSVIATVFDKLNQVYKEYLEAEQSYPVAGETGQSRGNPAQKRPVRTQAVIDQSDMYTHVLSVFTEKKDVSHKFIIAVLMEYIRSLNQFQITVQHYLYELVLKTLVHHNLFYMLHQFLQYHVLSDSKPLRLSMSNDEIVEVLLSKQQVLGALRFIRGVGGHDNISARKFLDAAKQTREEMLFYTIFRFFEQRNQRLRGSPHFTPGEHCEEHVAYFKHIFGGEALMKLTAS
ncbi:hypothetical protein EOD39_6432 [Acipenser ruthenus]|uniref:Mic1 domain-containing protein n=1 Tax=Acipenser ruthenus TaxID=7906 RepID=A0A662YYE7_ACIRT|nr:hypothetical protein EOD39_6432 [Acipenser ruthenus]